MMRQDETSRARLAQVVRTLDTTGCSRDAYRSLAALTPDMDREHNGVRWSDGDRNLRSLTNQCPPSCT